MALAGLFSGGAALLLTGQHIWRMAAEPPLGDTFTVAGFGALILLTPLVLVYYHHQLPVQPLGIKARMLAVAAILGILYGTLVHAWLQDNNLDAWGGTVFYLVIASIPSLMLHGFLDLRRIRQRQLSEASSAE